MREEKEEEDDDVGEIRAPLKVALPAWWVWNSWDHVHIFVVCCGLMNILNTN